MGVAITRCNSFAQVNDRLRRCESLSVRVHLMGVAVTRCNRFAQDTPL